jgi:intracellular multiplication protein IcmO
MTDKLIRGTTESQEIRHDLITRDTSSAGKKLLRWLKLPINLASVLLMLAVVSFIFSGVADLCLITAGLLTWFGLTRSETAPLKLPVQSKLLDLHEPHPATGKPMMANGIFFIGNELRTGKEVWLTNSDCRQHFLVLGTTGAGKAIPLDGKVHTPTGWKRLGDLRVGDLVSTPDGRSAPITGYYPQGELDICRVTFADGRTAEACPDHLWEVHHKHWNGKYKKGVSRVGAARPRLLRTKQIIELLEKNKGTFSVRLPEAVQKPAASVALDPYLLGTLIGDGNISSKVLRFSSVDAHIVGKVSKSLSAVGHELFHDEYAADCDYRVRTTEARPGHISPLRNELRALGLEGTHSHSKFIPDIYKESSIEQRWALVQGLMDTDGTADKRHGAISFATSSERLAKDFQEVVWSLGGIASINSKQSFYRDKSGNRVEGRPSYVVSIRHPEPTNFFSLPRKLALVDKSYQYADSLKLGITSIEVVRRAEAACILIDHEDHLFITDNYVVTHNTEALLGFAANAIAWGSGFLFCDGKGDVALFAKVYALCARFNRLDDLLVLNYMTGNKDLGASGGKLRSNTLNPFATGSSDTLTQMVVGLMDDAGGDGAMWKGRATAMFTGVMRALTSLRDNQVVDLNVSEIRDHLNLKKIIDLADVNKYPDMPQPIRKSIRSYLSSLPGFQEDKGYKQSQTTLDQHGYLEMQFTKILGSLADVYGHIFHTPYGEIDMADVVLNRRILVIMLPALEKSGDEIANLGKIVVATLKGMMGGTLGSEIEGTWDAVVENRPTNSPSPFIVILDEVGYYMVDGMDLMSAQARSLGFALFFAGQDINAMKRLNEKVFGSVQGNTNTKIIMRTEDPETAELAVKAGGKAFRAQLGSYEGEAREFQGRAYKDNMQAGLQEVDRINPLDLKAQGEGEMHVIHKEYVIRVKSFYANPEGSVDVKKLNLRTNHFITVEKPDADDIAKDQRMPEIVARLVSKEFAGQMKLEAQNAAMNEQLPEELGSMVRMLDTIRKSQRPPKSQVEVACAVFSQLIQESKAVTDNYAKEVRGSAGRTSRFPEQHSARDTHSRQAHQMMMGLDDDGEPPYEDSDPLYAEGIEQERIQRQPRKPMTRNLNAGRVRRNVPHGMQVDGGEIHDMADRIASNDGVLKTLQALHFDPAEESKDSVDTKLNQAFTTEGYDPVGGDDLSMFDMSDADRAAVAADIAVPPESYGNGDAFDPEEFMNQQRVWINKDGAKFASINEMSGDATSTKTDKVVDFFTTLLEEEE